jgi:hypothetical protein
MQSRATINGISRKSDLQSQQQSRRGSSYSIPSSNPSGQSSILSSSSTSSSAVPPPPPPPPPPRRTSENKQQQQNTIHTHRERKQTNPTQNVKFASIMFSFFSILRKQHLLTGALQLSRSFHLWRREVIYFRESMKTRSERTAALMLGGVDEESLDHMELTRKKSTKIGISLMRWILISMTSRNLTRAWRAWVEYVSQSLFF